MKVTVKSQQVLASSVTGSAPSTDTHAQHPPGARSSISDTPTPPEQHPSRRWMGTRPPRPLRPSSRHLEAKSKFFLLQIAFQCVRSKATQKLLLTMEQATQTMANWDCLKFMTAMRSYLSPDVFAS